VEFDLSRATVRVRVLLVIDAAVNMDGGNLLVEGSSFDEVLFELADQLSDTGTGELLTQSTLTASCYRWSSCCKVPQLHMSCSC